MTTPTRSARIRNLSQDLRQHNRSPRTHVRAVSFLAGTAALLVAATAIAQAPPDAKFEKFQTIKPEELKKQKVEWKAQLKIGLLATSGNSQQISVSGGGNISRKAGNNKLSLDASWAYARANPLTAADVNGNGFIDVVEVQRNPTTTANVGLVKARYDRFFFTHNSVYAVGVVGADTVAGKEVFAGAQAGYSRALYQDKRHELLAELGYDFTYENYDLAVTMGALDSNSIHSLRVFSSYKLTISKTVGGFAMAEALFNLNRELAPTADGSNEIAAFRDVRFLGKAGLTFNIWKNINFGFTFTLKYDNRPAPLPVFNALTPFAPGFVPLALKLDTLTEAQVIITFL